MAGHSSYIDWKTTGRPVVFIATFLACGCGETPEILQPAKPPPVGAFITLSVQASLDRDGLFPVPPPIESPYPQIPEVRARELAEAFRKTHLRNVIGILEEDRGGAINPEQLSVCGRTYYVEPSIEPVPPGVTSPARRHFGPWWVLSLCGLAGLPQVSLAVSAYATDLGIENGRLSYPPHPAIHGEYFHWLGVKVGNAEGLVAFPEAAVASVARATGRQVTGVPRLISFHRKFPQRASWRVELAAPASLVRIAGGKNTLAQIVFHGDDFATKHSGMWVEAEAQPSAHQFHDGEPPLVYGEKPVVYQVSVRRRQGLPLIIDPVRVERR